MIKNIKPLLWVDRENSSYANVLSDVFGRNDIYYTIKKTVDDTYNVYIPGEDEVKNYNTLDIAKSQCQENYKSRILSVIIMDESGQ